MPTGHFRNIIDPMNKLVDALLIVSIGGPEEPGEIRGFLDNILGQSKTGIPEKRLQAIAGRYLEIGGSSPANHQIREIISSLEELLNAEGPSFPVYMGNLFSRPLLPDTVRKMAAEGIRNALAFATSPFGSDFSCWRYRKALKDALEEVGEPLLSIRKLRLFFNHPDFISVQAARLEEAAGSCDIPREEIPLIFTAHSLPTEYPSTAKYREQIRETCSLVAGISGFASWELAFQSRSGPPSQPWLEPHPSRIIKQKADEGHRSVLLSPLGFMYDNLEVLYDLDREMGSLAAELGLKMLRAKTSGNHPGIIRMIRKLVLEQTSDGQEKEFAGEMGLPDDACAKCLCLKE